MPGSDIGVEVDARRDDPQADVAEIDTVGGAGELQSLRRAREGEAIDPTGEGEVQAAGGEAARREGDGRREAAGDEYLVTAAGRVPERVTDGVGPGESQQVVTGAQPYGGGGEARAGLVAHRLERQRERVGVWRHGRDQELARVASRVVALEEHPVTDVHVVALVVDDRLVHAVVKHEHRPLLVGAAIILPRDRGRRAAANLAGGQVDRPAVGGDRGDPPLLRLKRCIQREVGARQIDLVADAEGVARLGKHESGVAVVGGLHGHVPRAGERVVFRKPDDHRGQRRLRPRIAGECESAIRHVDRAVAVEVDRPGAEPADEIAAHAVEGERRGAAVIDDVVVAVALVDDERVGAGAAEQFVVAPATVDCRRPAATVDDAVAAAATPQDDWHRQVGGRLDEVLAAAALSHDGSHAAVGPLHAEPVDADDHPAVLLVVGDIFHREVLVGDAFVIAPEAGPRPHVEVQGTATEGLAVGVGGIPRHVDRRIGLEGADIEGRADVDGEQEEVDLGAGRDGQEARVARVVHADARTQPIAEDPELAIESAGDGQDGIAVAERGLAVAVEHRDVDVAAGLDAQESRLPEREAAVECKLKLALAAEEPAGVEAGDAEEARPHAHVHAEHAELVFDDAAALEFERAEQVELAVEADQETAAGEAKVVGVAAAAAAAVDLEDEGGVEFEDAGNLDRRPRGGHEVADEPGVAPLDDVGIAVDVEEARAEGVELGIDADGDDVGLVFELELALQLERAGQVEVARDVDADGTGQDRDGLPLVGDFLVGEVKLVAADLGRHGLRVELELRRAKDRHRPCGEAAADLQAAVRAVPVDKEGAAHHRRPERVERHAAVERDEHLGRGVDLEVEVAVDAECPGDHQVAIGLDDEIGAGRRRGAVVHGPRRRGGADHVGLRGRAGERAPARLFLGVGDIDEPRLEILGQVFEEAVEHLHLHVFAGGVEHHAGRRVELEVVGDRGNLPHRHVHLQFARDAAVGDGEHAEPADVEQADVRWADLDVALGEDLETVFVDGQGRHAVDAKQLRAAQRVGAAEPGFVEDQLARCRHQERLPRDLVGLREVGTPLAESHQGERLDLLLSGGVELQAGKSLEVDAYVLQEGQLRLQFHHAPDAKPDLRAGLDDHAAGGRAHRTDLKHGDATGGVERGAGPGDLSAIVRQQLGAEPHVSVHRHHRLGDELLDGVEPGIHRADDVGQRLERGVLVVSEDLLHGRLDHLEQTLQVLGVRQVTVQPRLEAGAVDERALGRDLEGRRIRHHDELLLALGVP